MTFSDRAEVETYNKLALHCVRRLDTRQFDLMDMSAQVRAVDSMFSSMALEMQAFVWSQELETKQIPSGWMSWWDHLRADHFPAWANRRWPPRRGKIRVSAKALYPELSDHPVSAGQITLQIVHMDHMPFIFDEKWAGR